MKFRPSLLLSAMSFKLFTTVMGRRLTVTNHCPFIIWPAIHTGYGAIPDHPTGWAAHPNSSVSFAVPGSWTIGLVWARRDCDFETDDPNPHSCLSGGCPGGQLLCDAHPISPVTVADFALSPDPNEPDRYTVSLIDGYNLPMSIDNDAGCDLVRCSVDLGPKCPKPLRGPYDSTRFSAGCNSACDAGLAPDPNNDPNCCTGIYDTSSTCTPSGVQYYSYFKSNCPNTVVYLFDESIGKSVFRCPSVFKANYIVTFCP